MDTKTNGRLQGKWHGFTVDTDHNQARAMFQERYGYRPARVVKSKCILLAGPILQDAPGAALSDFSH